MKALNIAPYFGAKANMMMELISEFNYECKVFYDLFGGMANVTLNTPSYERAFYNDFNPKIAHLVYVLSKKGNDLLGSMLETEYSQEAFDKALEISNHYDFKVLENREVTEEDIKVATATWVTLLQSYNGLMKTFRGIKKGNEQEIYHKKLVNKYELPSCLERVTIMNRNAFDILEEIKDKEEAMIYLDPPYTLKERTSKNDYECDFMNEDQLRLVNLVQDAKAKILISGYDNDIYNEALTKEKGWISYPIKEVCKSSSMVKGEPKPRVLEYIWKNY